MMVDENKPSGRVLGLIPARGGSKGLPGKNLALLGRKPLIAWTIEAALDAETINDVVVSTDAEEIATAAVDAGAMVPFMRPSELAEDDTSMLDVVLHALDVLEERGRHYDSVALLQPTSPLRRSRHIEEAAALKHHRAAEAVVSVVEMEHSPLWSNTLPPDGNMADFLRPEISGSRRQDLPTHFRLNGAIYLIDTGTLRTERAFVGGFAVAYLMPREASVDVDNAIDLEFAEFLLARGFASGDRGQSGSE